MTNQNIMHLAEIIKESKEQVDIDLKKDTLTIKTNKNSFWILLSVIGIAFSLLLIIARNRGPNNLMLGSLILWISFFSFWRMQNINKTLIIDLTRKMISISPNFFLHRWVLAKLLNINTTFTLNSFPNVELIYYRNLKYHWTYRIYFKKGLLKVYLLEFDKKETAQQVLNLLKL